MDHSFYKILKEEFWTEYTEEQKVKRQHYNLRTEIQRLKQHIANNDNRQEIEDMEFACNVNFYATCGFSFFGDLAHFGFSKLIEHEKAIFEEYSLYGLEDEYDFGEEFEYRVFIVLFQTIGKGSSIFFHALTRNYLEQTANKAREFCLADNDNHPEVCEYGYVLNNQYDEFA